MVALFVQNITSVDFSFLSATRGLIGETWIIDLTISGKLNQEGMIFDFGDVKKTIKEGIDNLFDHKLLVPALYTRCNILEEDYLAIEYESDVGNIIYHAPKEAICLLPVVEITPDTVKPHLINKIKSIVPSNVADIELTIYPEITTEYYFHYSHGLKFHTGDCQRMAHGHRSIINIKIDGKKNLQLEKNWSENLRDIYIVYDQDITTIKDEKNPQNIQLKYTAGQGDFFLSIPKDSCYIMDSSSTIELLASHVGQVIYLQLNKKHEVYVKLFEGYQKGAICHLFAE